MAQIWSHEKQANGKTVIIKKTIGTVEEKTPKAKTKPTAKKSKG